MTRERLVEIRREEDQQAGEAMGVTRHLYLPFHDGELPHCGETTAAMVRIIRQERRTPSWRPTRGWRTRPIRTT